MLGILKHFYSALTVTLQTINQILFLRGGVNNVSNCLLVKQSALLRYGLDYEDEKKEVNG